MQRTGRRDWGHLKMVVIAIASFVGVIGLAAMTWLALGRIRDRLKTMGEEHHGVVAQIASQSEVLHATRTRLVKAEGRLERYRNRLNRQNERIERLQSDLAASRLELAETRSAESRGSVQRADRFDIVDREIAKLKTNASTLRSESERRNQMQDKVNVELRGELRTQGRDRNALLLGEARKSSGVNGVEHLLLLLTIHRSGSTTFFDLVRSHPDAFFEPTNHFWEAAGLSGRRYPVDLSNGPTADIAVEVEPGLGALIPASAGGVRRPVVAVEKAHPQFFDFDVAAFADRINHLRETVPYEVSIAYGVRAPLEAMWSMVEYQRRSPNWYHFISSAEIPRFIADSMEALAELRELVDGPVVDYDDVVGSGTALRELFTGLTDPPVDESVFDRARSDLSQARRTSVQSGPFVGTATPPKRDPEGPNEVWSSCAGDIRRATAAYEKLIGE